MNRLFGRKQRKLTDEIHARILAETSAYLTECLRHPELAVRIPTVRAGRVRFPRSLSDAFWSPVLFE